MKCEEGVVGTPEFVAELDKSADSLGASSHWHLKRGLGAWGAVLSDLTLNLWGLN